MNVHAPNDMRPALASHPLDPLSAAEIARAATVIQSHYAWGDDLRVETIDVDEPAKDVVRAIVPGAPFERIARFNAFRRGHFGVWQGRIDLETGKIVSEHFDETARAMVAVEEVFDIERAVKADSALPGGLAAPRADRRARLHVRRPLDGRRFRPRGSSRVAASSTASSGCAPSRSTTTTPIRSRACMP